MCPRPSAPLEEPARIDENRCRCWTVPRTAAAVGTSVDDGVSRPRSDGVSRLRSDGGTSRGLRTDGGRTSGSLAGDEAVDGGALLERLAAADVVAADESGDLFLAGDVRRTWEAGMRRLRGVSDAELAAAAASAAPFPAEGRVDGDGDWVVVTRTAVEDTDGTENADDAADTGADDNTDGTAEVAPGETGDDVWLSRAHAVADTAAVAALSGRVDALTAARAAAPLRLFLEACPACGGTVGETTVGNRSEVEAVGDAETPVLACVECGEPLYEF
jgi:hypothetical protein